MAGLGSGVARRRAGGAGATPLAAVAIAVLATIVGVAGFVLFISLVAPPPPPVPVVPGRLVASDLTLQLQATGWITHDEVGGPTPASVQDGFQMPSSMMPGLPEHGTHRLYIEAVVSATGSGPADYNPREFAVRSTAGQSWALDQPATFSAGSLQPGQTRSLDLLFDVPEAVSQLDLVWTHGGQVQYVQVGASPPPAHDHGG